jgi:hypothetical protein
LGFFIGVWLDDGTDVYPLFLQTAIGCLLLINSIVLSTVYITVYIQTIILYYRLAYRLKYKLYYMLAYRLAYRLDYRLYYILAYRLYYKNLCSLYFLRLTINTFLSKISLPSLYDTFFTLTLSSSFFCHHRLFSANYGPP